MLRLVKAQWADPEAFRALLERVVAQLQRAAVTDHERWREFLSYTHALVYHRRAPEEIPALERAMIDSARTSDQMRELSDMAQTYAEHLAEEGRKQGLEQGLERGRDQGREEGAEQGQLRARRDVLLRQLRRRFREIPPDIEERIETENRAKRLDEWLDRVLDAGSIEDVGIA